MDASERAKAYHFTQAHGLNISEKNIDFFDTNLVYDTRAFIDPFLIRKSSKPEERALFKRFGDYFRKAYDMSMKKELSRAEVAALKTYLDIPEPKSIGLGYTEASHSGSGPGASFAERLLGFFLENSARKFLRVTEVFESGEFNPITLEIFVDKLGPDGISDISANLIMDYLIDYTQKQCKKLGIETKELPLDEDGFNFEDMTWNGGGYYKLPENPKRPGTGVVLVPKRFLRGYDPEGESMQTAVKGILSTDENLTHKFGSFLGKSVDNIPLKEVRDIFLEEHGVFARYIRHLQSTHDKPYDFVKDAQRLMALKTHRNIFAGIERTEKVEDCDDLKNLAMRFLSLVNDHFSRTDGWKDAWNESTGAERKEDAIGRVFRAMGVSFFDAYPNITFESQVNMGNGPVDFKLIMSACRIVMELKKLSNTANAGKPPLPAYIHGIERQLPAYAYTSKANNAIYITIQHWARSNSPKRHHDDRIVEIEALRPKVEKEMKKERKEFQELTYINILAIPVKSASKK